MTNFARLTLTLFLFVTAVSPAIAQIDKARDQFLGDFKSYYDKMVSFAEREQRDSAYKASEDMEKAFDAMYNFSLNIPQKLNNNNLRELGSEAQGFIDAMNSFKEKAAILRVKLLKVGEDYGAELSDVKREYANVQNKFNGLWLNFQKTGKDVGNKYEAIKQTCTSGCLP